MLIWLECVLCRFCACTKSANPDIAAMQDFVNRYGDEDFSLFEGVNSMHYRGTRDGLFLIAGIIPARQGEFESWAATNIYYSINDSSIVKLVRARDKWVDSAYVTIDSIYAEELTKRFVELGINEIQTDSFGTIWINLNEGENCIIRFGNDSIYRERSGMLEWKDLSRGWYTL